LRDVRFHRAQGATTLAMSKPAFAAYGDSANVFGGVSNPTGARAREARDAFVPRARGERSYRPRDTIPRGRDPNARWVAMSYG
jgi:hypothetical protein